MFQFCGHLWVILAAPTLARPGHHLVQFVTGPTPVLDLWSVLCFVLWAVPHRLTSLNTWLLAGDAEPLGGWTLLEEVSH